MMNWDEFDLKRNRLVRVPGGVVGKRDRLASLDPEHGCEPHPFHDITKDEMTIRPSFDAVAYDHDATKIGNVTIIETFARDRDGVRQLVSQQITARSGDRLNQFHGKSFGEALEVLIDRLKRVDHQMVCDFNEAYRPELYYGMTTWLSNLDK